MYVARSWKTAVSVHCHDPVLRCLRVRVAEFARSLALEFSFPTAERHVDINEDEGSSLIDYHKAFSVHVHNATALGARRGGAVRPHTFQWAFAGTFFCDFGLKHFASAKLCDLYAEMVQGRQILMLIVRP